MLTFLLSNLFIVLQILIAFCLISAIVIKVFLVKTCGRYKIEKNLSGRVVIITGATDGIGKAAARQLALHGATVHIPARNVKKAEKVADELRSETGNPNIHTYEMDLCDFRSIRNFVEKFLATKSPLHILINNAGICPWTKSMTKDGLSEVMQANHFGPFLLTQLLIDRLLESGPNVRIVTTSSRSFSMCKSIDFDDLHFEQRPYSPMMAYAWTKMFNIWQTRELARRYQGRGLAVNCCHPGFVRTSMTESAREIFHWVKVAILFARTPEVAAETLLHLSCVDDLEHVSGHFFKDCKHAPLTNLALDDRMARKLWEFSENVTGIRT